MERDEMILLDTHVLVRYLMGDKKLGRWCWSPRQSSAP
jgi:hypothetical protein